MAEKKSNGGKRRSAAPKSAEDQFERFLAERFAELRRELDEHLAAQGIGAKKTGQLAQFPRPAGQLTRGGWKLGIAALVLAAIAVPMVMQLNQKQAEMRTSASMPSADGRARPGVSPNKNQAAEDDAVTEEEKPAARRVQPAKTAAAKKKAAEIYFEKEAPEAPAKNDDAMAFSKRSLPPMTGADATPAPKGEAAKVAQASPAPAAPATERNARRTEMKDTDNLAAGAPAEMQSRSAPIADAKFRLKQEEIAEEEKAEMEKLWKEFEKNPEKFRKDAKRTERLRTLLARHDTRSRSRRLSTK